MTDSQAERASYIAAHRLLESYTNSGGTIFFPLSAKEHAEHYQALFNSVSETMAAEERARQAEATLKETQLRCQGYRTQIKEFFGASMRNDRLRRSNDLLKSSNDRLERNNDLLKCKVEVLESALRGLVSCWSQGFMNLTANWLDDTPLYSTTPPLNRLTMGVVRQAYKALGMSWGTTSDGREDAK